MKTKTIYEGNSRIMAYLTMAPYLIKDFFTGRKPKFLHIIKIKKSIRKDVYKKI